MEPASAKIYVLIFFYPSMYMLFKTVMKQVLSQYCSCWCPGVEHQGINTHNTDQYLDLPTIIYGLMENAVDMTGSFVLLITMII